MNLTAKIIYLSDLFLVEVIMEQVDYKEKYSGLEVIYEKKRVYSIIKKIIDIGFSAMGLIILSPLFIVVSILIKCESKGPIIFSQERVGLNGKRFKMYKFRSMVDNAEKLKEKLYDQNEMSGPMFKMKEDPRVTNVGKFIRRTSIDELPQLINVLKGDMSLVGPRPSLPNEVDEFEDWMKLDIKYVNERSILVDLKLIFETFFVLFGDKHAR